MPERPHPDMDRVRDTLRERDEEVEPPDEETPDEEEDAPEDDGDT